MTSDQKTLKDHNMKYIGIDGCRPGWFFVGLDENDKYSFGVISEISEIKNEINKAEQVLIDIPIGLREIDKKERLCDLEARALLDNRRSSVFPPPSRLALNQNDYHKASTVNFECTGRRLSKQSFAISEKIKEVDDFLFNNNLRNKIREMHPEVCFWALKGKKAMAYNKKKPEGIRERTLLLKQFYNNTERLIDEAKAKFLRKDLAVDDVVDAIVGAVTAKNKNNLMTLPVNPEIDNRGYRMEMVYCEIN